MKHPGGRPLAPYGKTKQIRVPLGCLQDVLNIIFIFKQQNKQKPQNEQ